jgi:hypothetical protein
VNAFNSASFLTHSFTPFDNIPYFPHSFISFHNIPYFFHVLILSAIHVQYKLIRALNSYCVQDAKHQYDHEHTLSVSLQHQPTCFSQQNISACCFLYGFSLVYWPYLKIPDRFPSQKIFFSKILSCFRFALHYALSRTSSLNYASPYFPRECIALFTNINAPCLRSFCCFPELVSSLHALHACTK